MIPKFLETLWHQIKSNQRFFLATLVFTIAYCTYLKNDALAESARPTTSTKQLAVSPEGFTIEKEISTPVIPSQAAAVTALAGGFYGDPNRPETASPYLKRYLPEEKHQYTQLELARAAFERENTAVATITDVISGRAMDYEEEPDFDPIDFVDQNVTEQTPELFPYQERLLEARSEAEGLAVLDEIRREQANDFILDLSPRYSKFIAQLILNQNTRNFTKQKYTNPIQLYEKNKELNDECSPNLTGFDVCQKVKDLAENISSELPIRINGVLLDKATAAKNKLILTGILGYDKKHLELQAKNGGVTTAYLLRELKKFTIKNVCRLKSPGGAFIDLGGKVQYRYYFNDKTYFASVDIDKTSCQTIQ